jgi:DNA sulfur modification protein DndD
MRFEKLMLENFSSYYGKHTIEFNTTEQKPVTIIVGGSGFGKTSIFDAINWALYGIQYEPTLLSQSEKNITDYVNETALKQAERAKEHVEMSCSLFFEHEGKHYRIEQEIVAKKTGDHISITDRDSSIYENTTSGNFEKITYTESFLNEILPSNVRDYFLFNGDRINKLSLPGSSKEIRDGIYRVVDLELLQNGTDHLKETAKKLRKNTKDVSVGEMADIQEQFSAAIEDVELLKKKLVDLAEDKRALDANIEIVEEKFRSYKGTIDLQTNKDRLKTILETKNSELKQSIVELRSVSAIASTQIVLDDIEELKKVLNEKRNKGEIPSSISENLLRELIDMKRCICGTEFTKTDSAYKELNRRLVQEIEKHSKGKDLNDLFYELNTTVSNIKSARINMIEIEKRRTNIEKVIANSERQINEIDEKLGDVPGEDIPKLGQRIKELTENLDENKYKALTTQEKIREKERRIQELSAQRDELAKQQEKVKGLLLRDELAQKAAEELEKIFTKFAEDSRHDVEKLTREEFQKFIPSARALSIGIDSEFHYDVKDQNENPALQQLSNGQKQALSLAYITSISRVSEKNPPLIIDMPFGRLDKDVQDNIANRLPDLASQVILLMLPETEWNDHTRSILKSRSSNVYILNFDAKKRQTTIGKG